MISQTNHAGAALIDITPADSQFLYGYPHVPRMSEGTHDPLYAQALYLSDNRQQVMFISADLVWVSKRVIIAARQRIADKIGLPASHVMITASHTHSGPIVGDMLITESDPVVPPSDPQYAKILEDRIVAVAMKAHATAKPAQVGVVRADVTGIGTNRHDPKGPSILEAPVLAVKSTTDNRLRAVMTVCVMHPTVLHEDSKLYSGDFPGMARQYLCEKLGDDVVFVYHMGTAGNQSPRHVTRGNTFAEAQRLGGILGRAVEQALTRVSYAGNIPISCNNAYVDLPLRDFPDVAEAEANLKKAADYLQQLRSEGAPQAQVRTAECDWFGAEETLTLARASATGRIEAEARALMPAEIQLVRVGNWKFIGWPGEVFVEYGLAVREHDPDAFVITLAGGELPCYLVTQEGVDNKWYEAGNAIFKSPQSPQLLVETTLTLLRGEQSSRKTTRGNDSV